MIRFAVGAGGLDNRVYLTGAPNQLFVIGLSSDWRGEQGEARPGPTRPDPTRPDPARLDNSKVFWLFFSFRRQLHSFVYSHSSNPSAVFCTLLTIKVWGVLSPPHKMFYCAQK